MSRLLIADDHPLFLDGLRQYLRTSNRCVVAVAQDAGEALAILATSDAEMLILDVRMAQGGGLYVLRTLRAAGNNIPVIFLTVGMLAAETLEAIECGVNGIVMKTSEPESLLTCIAAVRDGETWIEPTILEPVLRRSLTGNHDDLLASYGLTGRQKELIRFVALGLRNREIAERCGLTEGTVKIHLHHIYAKLGIHSRGQLMVMLAAER